MQDAIAGFQSAPFWAQIAIVLFATMAVVMFVEPSLKRRKFRRKFDAIARGLGQQPPVKRGWPMTCSLRVDDRAFQVTHDFRTTSKGSSYRGPSGYLLITSTRLASERWSMHQVDVLTLGRIGSWFLSDKRLTGDTDFDARFVVRQDGLPVREAWLDADTRAAFARFLDAAPRPGVIWIREGELQFTMQDPWTGLDGPVLQELMRRQGALAAALDRTASRQM